MVEDLRRPSCVLNWDLKYAFGHTECTEGDGIIALRERGDGIRSVADVLGDYFEAEPGDAFLRKWVNGLIKAAEKAFVMVEVRVISRVERVKCTPEQISTKPQEAP